MAGIDTGTDGATYDLNLAPMLDIIVSIIPMLLMSVAFVQVTMIETPIPQVVQQAIENQEAKNEISISLKASKESGFKILITNKGQQSETPVALKEGKLDLDSLHQQLITLKGTYPDVFRMELLPDESLNLDDIVSVMDTIRTTKAGEPKMNFIDKTTGKNIQTNLMFPDVVFGNVTGG